MAIIIITIVITTHMAIINMDKRLCRLGRWLRVAWLPLILAMPAAVAGEEGAGAYAVYHSDSSFEDVMDGLRLAIEERGLFINNVMHMNAMLERTGADLGMEQPLFKQAQSVEFCSAVLSRRMMAENPARIVNCPFIIAVYTLAEEPGQTLLAYRRLPAAELADSAVMGEVAGMLAAIAEQAVSW
jgi:uncharacterized protein (DUF302 family)